MNLKDFMSVLVLDGQIKIKSTIQIFIPKHKQVRIYVKEICHLSKMVKSITTDKLITIYIQKEIQNISYSSAIIRIDIFNMIYWCIYDLVTS